MMEPQKAGDRARSFWIIEPRYTTVQFSIKNLIFFTVQGSFTDFLGKITLDESDLRQSSVEVTIKTASINTGNKRRDNHLRSPAFLNVFKHPDIRFQSTSVEKGRDRDALKVSGILTIREKSKELMIDVIETDHSRSPQGEEVAYYAAQTKIDRFDYGIKYGPLLIGRILKVTIQVQATKQT